MTFSIPKTTTEKVLNRSVSIIFLALPTTCLLWMALQWLIHGIDLPYWDDWRAYWSGEIGSFAPKNLFLPANDTLSPVGKTLDAFDFRFLHGNSVAYQFLSMTIILSGLLYFQWILLRSIVRDRLLCAAAFSLTILMIQPGSYWGIQNIAYQQALPLVFILASIYVSVCTQWFWPLRAVTLVLLGLLSGLSYISGAFAVLAIALTLLICITLNRRVFSRMTPDAIALLSAGLATVAIQAWVILIKQGGHIHTGTAWALPNQSDFWLYLLGKLGRSLMLPASLPLISFLIVISVSLLAVAIAGGSIRNVFVSESRDSRTGKANIIILLLLAAIFCYLLMVASGRTDLHASGISSPLQVFAFGFLRFHFFWATLIWPWIFVGVGALWADEPRLPKPVLLGGVGLVLVFAISQGVFAHSSYFSRDEARSEQNAECLRNALLAGDEINCLTLYPRPMGRAYANAVISGASFVRYFPPTLLGARAVKKPVDLLASPALYSVKNADFTVGDSSELHISAGRDVQVVWSLADQTILRNCLAFRVEASIDTEKTDTVQFFYQTADDRGFSGMRSQRQRLASHSTEPARFVVVSPTGFRNSFRLDPVAGSQPVTVRHIEMSCVLRKE